MYFTKSGDGWCFDTEYGKLTLTGELGVNPFEAFKSDVRSVEALPGASISDGTTLFQGMSYLIDADLSKLDVSKCTNMNKMFMSCYNLAFLDLTSWDITKVENMEWMFAWCSKLERVQTGELWNPDRVTDISGMFQGCEKLRSLDDVFAWNSSALRKCSNLFEDCKSLEEVNLCSMNVSKVSSLRRLFKGCTALRTLDLSDWETYRVTVMSEAFDGCIHLESLDLTGWHIQDDTSTKDMFHEVPQTAHVRTDAISVVQRLPEGMPYEYDESGDERRKAQVEFCLGKGYAYFWGAGVVRDYEYAGDWFEKAAITGMLDEFEKESLAWRFEEIGKWYLEVLQEDPDNSEYSQRVDEIFTWAAKFGGAEYAWDIAIMYDEAEPLPDHEAKAANWYKAAAEKGNAHAQYELAYRYMMGKGVPRNPEVSAEWCEKAASQGIDEAQYTMGQMYYYGDLDEIVPSPFVRDYHKAAEWYEKAVAQGHAEAMLQLGNLYISGLGVNSDRAKAKALWQKAADQGIEGAANNLKKFF